MIPRPSSQLQQFFLKTASLFPGQPQNIYKNDLIFVGGVETVASLPARPDPHCRLLQKQEPKVVRYIFTALAWRDAPREPSAENAQDQELSYFGIRLLGFLQCPLSRTVLFVGGDVKKLTEDGIKMKLFGCDNI